MNLDMITMKFQIFHYKNKKTIHNLLYWQGDEYIGCGHHHILIGMEKI